MARILTRSTNIAARAIEEKGPRSTLGSYGVIDDAGAESSVEGVRLRLVSLVENAGRLLQAGRRRLVLLGRDVNPPPFAVE